MPTERQDYSQNAQLSKSRQRVDMGCLCMKCTSLAFEVSLLILFFCWTWWGEQAPSLHQELQKQLASQQVILGGGPPLPSAATPKVLSFSLPLKSSLSLQCTVIMVTLTKRWTTLNVLL